VQAKGEVLKTFFGGVDPSPQLRIFKFAGGSNFYAFKAESGAKIFGMGLVGSEIKVDAFAASLPIVSGTASVVAARVSPTIVNALGSSVQLNGTIIYYADANSVISHIYFMNSSFVTKEIIGQCTGLTSAGLLPSGLSCSGSISSN